MGYLPSVLAFGFGTRFQLLRYMAADRFHGETLAGNPLCARYRNQAVLGCRFQYRRLLQNHARYRRIERPDDAGGRRARYFLQRSRRSLRSGVFPAEKIRTLYRLGRLLDRLYQLPVPTRQRWEVVPPEMGPPPRF